MKLTIGISPCPNDTFIFDALLNQKIETNGIDTEIILEDVETLNKLALNGKLDITKLSFPAFFKSLKNYELLNAGAALGKGVGPLLVAKEITDIKNLSPLSVAIPGTNTTANFLLHYAFPEITKRKILLFSEIEDAVLNGETDLGLIIHENRFTYQQKGLLKIADLGNIWEEKMNAPIPLGGIAIKRNIDPKIKKRIDALTRQSVEYAFNNYPSISQFVKDHAQAMHEDVMRQHVDLYVNNYSIALGDEGKSAIRALYHVFLNGKKNTTVNLFLND